VSEVDVDLGAKVLERLRMQPGGPELLELAQGRDDMELVGGAVRDLLLEHKPRELDVVVAHDAPALAQTLGGRLEATVTVHERFGTAFVEHGATRLDFATCRAESYPAPGALPEVRKGTPMEDLLRRDFTVNAIAVTLDGPHPGELRAVPHALEDLRGERLRVLHDASFADDPTRLLRLARYHARLGFEIEERTAGLARKALSEGALGTVSGARVGAELRLALREAMAPVALAAMHKLGVLAAVHPRLRFELPLAERALALLSRAGRDEALLSRAGRDEALLSRAGRDDALLARDGGRQAVLLAALVLALTLRADAQPGAEARALLDRLEFPQGERDRALSAATAVARLHEELPRCTLPSELHAHASGVPLEAVALAGALGADAAARWWLEEVRQVHLQIDGEDLLARGVPQGPEVGRRLRETLLLRLDGKLDEGREAELAAALELP
jgi:tRNA nucleotidyltransferase (CCA-adding enzyme)